MLFTEGMEAAWQRSERRPGIVLRADKEIRFLPEGTTPEPYDVVLESKVTDGYFGDKPAGFMTIPNRFAKRKSAVRRTLERFVQRQGTVQEMAHASRGLRLRTSRQVTPFAVNGQPYLGTSSIDVLLAADRTAEYRLGAEWDGDIFQVFRTQDEQLFGVLRIGRDHDEPTRYCFETKLYLRGKLAQDTELADRLNQAISLRSPYSLDSVETMWRNTPYHPLEEVLFDLTYADKGRRQLLEDVSYLDALHLDAALCPQRKAFQRLCATAGLEDYAAFEEFLYGNRDVSEEIAKRLTEIYVASPQFRTTARRTLETSQDDILDCALQETLWQRHPFHVDLNSYRRITDAVEVQPGDDFEERLQIVLQDMLATDKARGIPYNFLGYKGLAQGIEVLPPSDAEARKMYLTP